MQLKGLGSANKREPPHADGLSGPEARSILSDECFFFRAFLSFIPVARISLANVDSSSAMLAHHHALDHDAELCLALERFSQCDRTR